MSQLVIPTSFEFPILWFYAAIIYFLILSARGLTFDIRTSDSDVQSRPPR